jgi:hypothetical protein
MYATEGFEFVYDRLKEYQAGNYIDFTKYTLGKAIAAVSGEAQAARIKGFIREYMPEALPAPVLALKDQRILVVGECCVRVLAALEEALPGAELFGAELNPEYLDWDRKLYEANLWNAADLSFDAPLYRFDAIFFASPFKREYVLLNTLINAVQHLVPQGMVIARFRDAALKGRAEALAEGQWPFGVTADYFTSAEISRYVSDCGYRVEAVTVNEGEGLICAKSGFLWDEKMERGGGSAFPRALMLLEQYPNCKRDRAPASHSELFLSSLRKSGLVERVDALDYEYMSDVGIQAYLDVIARYADLFRPSAVFYYVNCFQFHAGLMKGLKALREKTGISLIAIEGDFVTMRHLPIYQEQKDQYYSCASQILAADIPNAAQYIGDARFIGGVFGSNPMLFDSRSCEKDIDVSFVGYMRGRMPADKYSLPRKQMLEYIAPRLERKGIRHLFLDTSGRPPQYSWDYYIDICRRSRMIVNFSESLSGLKHVKGRVFEAIASGALLLELENPALCGLFETGKHMVEFSTPEEFMEKISYYHEHEAERLAITAAARDRLVDICHEYNTWRFFFERCGFKIAHPATARHYDLFQAIMEKAEGTPAQTRWNEGAFR